MKWASISFFLPLKPSVFPLFFSLIFSMKSNCRIFSTSKCISLWFPIIFGWGHQSTSCLRLTRWFITENLIKLDPTSLSFGSTFGSRIRFHWWNALGLLYCFYFVVQYHTVPQTFQLHIFSPIQGYPWEFLQRHSVVMFPRRQGFEHWRSPWCWSLLHGLDHPACWNSFQFASSFGPKSCVKLAGSLFSYGSVVNEPDFFPNWLCFQSFLFISWKAC